MICILFFSCKQRGRIVNSKAVPDANAVEIEKDIKKYNFDGNFILGKFDYKTDTTFIKVDNIYTSKMIYIKKEVYCAFVKMFEHAKRENINLEIISGTRNFYEQRAIWERKWENYNTLKSLERALKILEYTSMPSTSRHHWGTDIDLNSFTNFYFEAGIGKKEYDWLVKNANSYGFYQVYTSKVKGRRGYNLEKWHWSYLPLSEEYLKFYNENIKLDDIIDFKGADLANELNIIEDYVNGIDSVLK